MEYEYIEIKVVAKLPKTEIYGVYNKSQNSLLGLIKWYGAWRQYCYRPCEKTLYSAGCMKDITKFIEYLMNERKEKKLEEEIID